jgi:adenylylsulfate reductase subunit A
MSFINMQEIKTDILIIGGGAAGCMAAIIARQSKPDLDVTILEKANITRSGCLAMGLNAVNAYLVDSTPEDYVEYVKRDNYNLIRSDLVLSIGKQLNRMTHMIEKLGVPLPRDNDGRFIARSSRSVLMYGEQLKPLLADSVISHGVHIYNRTPAYRLLYDREGKRICGAAAFNMRSQEFMVIKAKAVLISTGGASGIYRPSNPGLAKTKTWYCPYNAGTGLAMGLRAGAEMTSFEMRFVALRTKDVIAPTGTLVLGKDIIQCNARGEKYMKNREDMLGRPATTCERLLFTIDEHKKGTGPCYVDVSALNKKQYNELIESYLNMAPSIVIDLLSDPTNPRTHIEICGSEPYINGGHGMAGFWIYKNRQTTLEGLYAAGDVAGGAPKKYISGCFAEAEMAINNILENYSDIPDPDVSNDSVADAKNEILSPFNSGGDITFNEVEERLQKIMEEYAGGSTQNYETSRDKLLIARDYLLTLLDRAGDMSASDSHELMRVHDTMDRILLARTMVEHMIARSETRWPCYQTRLDFPMRNDLEFLAFINSRMEGGKIGVFKRNIKPPYACLPLEGRNNDCPR